MLKKTDKFIREPDAVKQIETYGIPYPMHGIAESVCDAVTLADKMGYPVVMKIISPDAPHKTDVGGVLVGVESAMAVQNGYQTIVDNMKDAQPDAVIEGVLICRQAKVGVEVIVGATKDPVFGMVIMFGLGGVFTEVLKDVTFRAVPIELIDAEDMIQEIKGYPLLMGARGQAPCDLEKLAELLMSVSRFIIDRPDIVELDLNPVRVYPERVEVLDVRIICQ